jgi:hypothetical protein
MALLKFLAGLIGFVLLLVPAVAVAMGAHALGFPSLAEILFPLVLIGTFMLMSHLRM